ncbi:terminase small subunit [Chromobacterium haemolyticum]|uniref:terminase small subunit n=1 Tax=Chromobacterium haemolyticum TaxID=394935 RepID=UPI0040574D91
MALTPRKRAFADAVLAGKSNKDAAIAAGYSEKTASAAGSRLVKDPDVVEYLAKHRKAVENGSPPPSAPTFDLGKALQHSDPLAFLKAAMNDPELEPRLRIDAAKAMLPFTHKKLGEGGKKDEKDEAAKRAANKFGALAPPLKLVSGK